jgi:antitoxin (DNA-binding transcriptional repressor) of toxin-antitoxin stability system
MVSGKYHKGMDATISETELAQHLPEILNRVRDGGEAFVIERDGEALAALGPARRASAATWRTLAEQLAAIPLADPSFADDLEDIQRNQPQVPANPWHS